MDNPNRALPPPPNPSVAVSIVRSRERLGRYELAVDKLTLQRALREERERRRLSQPQLARMSGLHQTTIAGYEVGRRTPSAAALARLAVALGWSRTKMIALALACEGDKAGRP